MNRSMSATFSTADLLQEITPHFVPTEDAAAVRKVHRLLADNASLLEKRNVATKELIRGAVEARFSFFPCCSRRSNVRSVALVQRVAPNAAEVETYASRSQTTYSCSVAEMAEGVAAQQEELKRAQRGDDEAQRLKAALAQKENAALQLEAVAQQERALDLKLAQVQAQKNDVDESLLELKQTKLVEIPLIKHALGLYANITSLRWDYSSESIKGHVARDDDVREFEFPANASRAQVANKLWDMMA